MSKDKLIKTWAEDIELDSTWTLNEAKRFLIDFYDSIIDFENFKNSQNSNRRTD